MIVLSDQDWEVCLHTLRLLQSVLVVEEEEDEGEGEGEGRPSLGASLLDPELRARVSQLTYRGQSSLRLAALQTLEDLQQVRAAISSVQHEGLLARLTRRYEKEKSNVDGWVIDGIDFCLFPGQWL